MYSKIPPAAVKLLDFIAGPESKGNYLAYFGNVRSADPLPETLDAVLVFQKNLVQIQRKPSSAVGRYQFMPVTLRDLMRIYDIPGSTRFTPDLQDELAFYLLKRRGYDRWVAGTISDSLFADQLSMEWASLPYQTGRSFYDKDGLNKSLVSRGELISTIAEAKKLPAAKLAPTPQAPEAQKEKPMEGLLGSVASMIFGAAGKVGTLATVASQAPHLIEGAIKSIDEVERGVGELIDLANSVKAGKWNEVPNKVEAIVGEFRQIMINFGFDHDKINENVKQVAFLDAVKK